MNHPKVIILNNQILPYRLSLFQAITEKASGSYEIFFCSRRLGDREWDTTRFEIPFKHTVLAQVSFRIPKPEYRGEFRRIIINPWLLIKLIARRPDVIIAYEYSIPSLIALFACKLIGARFIIWTDMTAHTERNLTRGQQLTREIIRPHADAFICVSNAAKDHLIEMGFEPASIVVAPQTFAAELYPGSRRNHARTEIRLIYVGSLSERKGVQNLLSAMVLVHQENPDVRLSIVGNGMLKDTLQQYVIDNGLQRCVTFEGFFEPSELPAMYGQADIFVFPTLEDTFGVVVLEAMASGLPVICSKYAGVASHLIHEGTALICDPKDQIILSKNILRLVQDTSLRMALAAKSQKVSEAFKPEEAAKQFITTVDYVLDYP